MRRNAVLLILLLLPLLSSCGEERRSDEPLREKGVYPDMTLENAVYDISSGDGGKITLGSKRMSFYSSDGYALLDSLSFSSFGANGEEEASGKADKARIDLDANRIEMSGNVLFRSAVDDMEITADRILFDSEKNEIETPGVSRATSERGSFEGTDFKGNISLGEYSFSEIIRGELKK